MGEGDSSTLLKLERLHFLRKALPPLFPERGTWLSRIPQWWLFHLCLQPSPHRKAGSCLASDLLVHGTGTSVLKCLFLRSLYCSRRTITQVLRALKLHLDHLLGSFWPYSFTTLSFFAFSIVAKWGGFSLYFCHLGHTAFTAPKGRARCITGMSWHWCLPKVGNKSLISRSSDYKDIKYQQRKFTGLEVSFGQN